MMRSTVLAVVLLLALAASAAAREAKVRSFDGTELAVTFHPAAGLGPGKRAPTILQTHGWGGQRERSPDAASSEGTGNIGTGPLRRAGFNVLTWDSRGFGESGGTVQLDYKGFEGRDVKVQLGSDPASDGFSLNRLRARSIDSSASSRGYQPSTLTTFHSGVL